ncbi:hypothetical protein [Streptomyces varsoviensis]|uniref:Uncharacterized protein n=1 Tax=Streptomyces varsoviensis TaxID=67373 RepID=A0ABR5J976_9ACTN|nr:hypothetical protein [Streptomyces varsoviensis]KOG89987.1 hypothetical protein ADK38_11285 [Streptomyces varsoviensis]
MLTINVALLIAVIVIWRLRRRVQARTRFDQGLTVFMAVLLGVLIAPTDFGRSLLDATGQFAQSVSQWGH